MYTKSYVSWSALVIPVALLILLLLVLLPGKARRVGAAILAVLVIVLLAVAFFAIQVTEQPQSLVASSAATSAGSRWEPSADMLAKADLQLSLPDATRALAEQVKDLLSTVTDTPGAKIVVDGPTDKRLLQSLVSLLRNGTTGPENPDVELLNPEVPLAGVRVVISLSIHGGVDYNNLQADLRGPKGTSSLSVRYVDKLWASDAPRFLSTAPHRYWIMEWSTQPASSAQEAIDRARARATFGVENLVESEIPRRGLRLPEDASVVNSFVANRLSMVERDRVVQSFPRPYGPVYRAGVLIEVSPPALQPIVTEFSSLLAQERAWYRNTFVSMGALVLLIYLVYLFLNLMTKGYFSTRLRVAAVVCLAAGIALVLLLV